MLSGCFIASAEFGLVFSYVRILFYGSEKFTNWASWLEWSSKSNPYSVSIGKVKSPLSHVLILELNLLLGHNWEHLISYTRKALSISKTVAKVTIDLSDQRTLACSALSEGFPWQPSKCHTISGQISTSLILLTLLHLYWNFFLEVGTFNKDLRFCDILNNII